MYSIEATSDYLLKEFVHSQSFYFLLLLFSEITLDLPPL